MFLPLFLCLTAGWLASPSSQYTLETKPQPVSGCFMQQSSWTDGGLTRTFQLDIANSDEVFFVLTLDLSDWDKVTVEIRNLQHNSADFTLRPYRKGQNKLETWLVQGKYEITLKAENNFAAASLCYRYSPSTRPLCKNIDAYAVFNYATFVQCRIVVPPSNNHRLARFNFKYGNATVGIDKSDISASNYDFSSITSPLYVPLQPSNFPKTLYFMLAIESYPVIVTLFGYSIHRQEYSNCLWKDTPGDKDAQLTFTLTIPSPGALTTLMLGPKINEDLDFYLNRIPAPSDVFQYEYRSENDAGEQDLIQVWLPGGSYTAVNLGFSAFTGGSFCYSYSKPDDVPHCKEKDVIFGEFYYPYKKCKIEVKPCESEQLLSVDFDNDALVYVSEGDASVSQSSFQYSTSSSPLFISVPQRSTTQTYYVQLQSYRFIRNVNFGYRLKKKAVVKSCFAEALSGGSGQGSQSYQLVAPFETSRVYIAANPGPASKFTLKIAPANGAGSPSSTIQSYSTTSADKGKLAVIDTWLSKGTYQISYSSDSAFTSASICYQLVEHSIPDCKAKNVFASIRPDEFFQCKITVGKAKWIARELEVIAAPRRLIWPPFPTVQREIFVSVDQPLSPGRSFQFSNKDAQGGLLPFVNVNVPAEEGHTYYVLIYADFITSDYSNTFFSHSIRPQFLVDSLQRYNNVKPRPSPDGCGHSQYWNAGEQFATALGVVGGQDALSHEFPWQVSVVTNTSGTYCGGAVLNKRWVITAGRCCESYTRIDIRVGSDANVLDSSAALLQPEQVVIHPYFRASSLKSYTFDFCLLRLSEDLDLSSWRVRPICLPDSCDDTCRPGDRVVLSGYGYKSRDLTFANKLQKVVLPILEPSVATDILLLDEPSDQSLSRSFTRCPAFPIGRLDGGIDGCTGDYGSPVACFKKGAFYLEGVFSFGDTCGTPHYPTGAAKVCEVSSWIHRYIDADQ